MLTPRLTNCPACLDIILMLENIDCRLNLLAKRLYNNVIFSLNQSFDSTLMFDLLCYKRILLYKYNNPDYATYCQCTNPCLDCTNIYTLERVASKVNLLTLGCVKPCYELTVVPNTTTTSTTCPPTTTSSTTTSTSTSSTSTTTSSSTSTLTSSTTSTSTSSSSTSTSTSSTSSSSTSTSTSTSSSTSSTTTTEYIGCKTYDVYNPQIYLINFGYIDCYGNGQVQAIDPSTNVYGICVSSYTPDPNLEITETGTCGTSTSSTTSTLSTSTSTSTTSSTSTSTSTSTNSTSSTSSSSSSTTSTSSSSTSTTSTTTSSTSTTSSSTSTSTTSITTTSFYNWTKYLGTTNNYATSELACINKECVEDYYLANDVLIEPGVTIYNSINPMDGVIGGNQWIVIRKGECTGDTYYAIRVNDTSLMLEVVDCITFTTTTTSTSSSTTSTTTTVP